jgi:hypothetical protein
MIYVKLRSVNFHGTVTNERSHVAKELSNYLIKQYGRGNISRLEFATKLVTDKKKNDMSALFLLSYENARPRSK